MKDPVDPEDQKVLVQFLRILRGLSQEEQAARAGLDPSSVRRYKKGKSMPRKGYEQLVAGADLPIELVEACHLPAIQAGRAASLHFSSDLFADLESAAVVLDRTLSGAHRAAIAALLAELERDEAAAAESSWEAKTWRFVELLCQESEEVAAAEADRALKPAELALRVAERAPGKGARRSKLEANVWIFLGNARRVGGELTAAETAFTRARELWPAWSGPTPIPLAAWRLPDRQASLRRHQGRFTEALALHAEALAAASPEAAGRILLNKAVTQEHQGEPERALATLHEAELRIDAAREPRLLFGVRFNRLVNLCHLGRYAEAAELLPAVQAMALGRPLDEVRVRWLGAKIDAGLGRRAEAAAALDQVRREFLARRIAFDAAAASLELAVLYLEDGRSAEVKALAAELAPIFAAQNVARETLASVKLFCEAVRQETATAELARRCLKEMRRAG